MQSYSVRRAGMADMLRTSWSGFMVKLEQNRVEPVLLLTATIDAVTNSEQLGHMVRSILHPAFRRHLYTGQVASRRCTLITTACHKTIFV